MVEIVSRREQIMVELMRRLALVYPSSQIDRGFTSENVSTYDHFFVFDLPETLEMGPETRGAYLCTFPVSVSYWLQCDPKEMYTIGNEHMERIRLAIELDERFADADEHNLCISYTLDESAILWYDEGVLDVEFLFMFTYMKDAGWVKNPFK
jgi:hypothetical protein